MVGSLLGLYIANATLLICHEIDSAYWREWEMLRLPGGQGLFLGLHLPLVAAVLVGLVLVAQGRPGGLWFALGLALAGVAACVVHGVFLSKGHPSFRATMSIFILAVILPMSALLGWAALQGLSA